MKLFKYFLIFTTIILTISISLVPASALDTTLSIVSVDLFPTHSVSYFGIEVYDNYQSAIDNTLWPTIELEYAHQDYDNYIVFELIDASGNANLQEDYYDSLIIKFSPLAASDADVNRLQFRFSLIGSENETSPKIGFQIGNVTVPTTDYTISYTRQSYGWIEEQPNAFYVQFYCDVLFDSDVDLTQGISLLCDYDFINPGNHEYFQIMGVDNPKVSYTSVSDYVADISDDVKILTDITNQNNIVLNEILGSLNASDPELDQALEDLSSKLEDINRVNSDVDLSLKEIISSYGLSELPTDAILDIDYITNQMRDLDNPVLLLWDFLWENAIVSTFVTVGIAFATLHFWMYKFA